MRLPRWLAVAVLIFSSTLALLAAPGEAGAQSYEAEELNFLELINQYRQQNGLEPLLLSDPLSVASERHSEDMGTYGFFSHTTQQSSYYPTGADHVDRAAQEGYDYNTYTAENLAYGQATAREVFEAWRTSAGHNANMLGDYKVIGIGQVWVNGTPYWTTVFGAYVDPSATSGGGSGGESGNGSAAVERQAPPSNVRQPVPEALRKAATDQYAEEKPERRAAVTGQYEEEKPARQLAAAPDQYATEEAPKQQAAGSGSAGQPEPAAVQSGTGEVRPAAQDGADASAPEPSDEPEERSSVASAMGITELPDTGGFPLSPLAGALLAAGALARRIF